MRYIWIAIKHPMETVEETHIKAVWLYNLPNGGCTFKTGTIPNRITLEVNGFFAQTHIDDYQKTSHPAPRKQYVVTLAGKLEFTVTNGDTFIVEPGVILIAEDTHGHGHTWRLTEGDTWQRLYLPFTYEGNKHFVEDRKVV